MSNLQRLAGNDRSDRTGLLSERRAGLARWLACAAPIVGALAILAVAALPARAVDIELRDVAPDRIERQRAHGYGQLPLAGTPDLGRLEARLEEKGLKLGNAIFIRIYKIESELELWMMKGDRFVLLATYPICHWSGTIGPKLREGDAQAPEGFYTVSMRQMKLRGRWQRAFNLGFPNPLDQLHARTGSFILVHGGCSSVGCFAMTDPVVDEIYRIAEAALNSSQDRFHVHVFPFRMTEANMARHGQGEWRSFWLNLKEAYDSFERTRQLPRIAICEQRYRVEDGKGGDLGPDNPYRHFGRCTNDPVAQAAQEAAQQDPAPQPEIEASVVPITATGGALSLGVPQPVPVLAPEPRAEPKKAERIEPEAPPRRKERTPDLPPARERTAQPKAPAPRRPVARGEESAPRPALPPGAHEGVVEVQGQARGG